MTFGHVADGNTFNDATTSTFTASKPAGTASGDLLIAFVEANGASASVTASPSGWTRIGAQTGNSNVLSEVWTKTAGGSEPSTYSWTLSAGLRGRVTIHAYTGQDTTNPIDAYNTGLVTSVAAATTSLTVVGTGCLLITSAFGRHPAGTHTFTNGTGGDTARAAHGATGGGSFDFCCGTWESAGAVGSGANARTIASSATENVIAWHTLSLKPLAGTLVARVYQDFIDAPAAAPALRARVYQDYIQTIPPSDGKTARVYADSIQAPLPAGHPGQSGVWVARGGSWHNAIPHTAVNGEW